MRNNFFSEGNVVFSALPKRETFNMRRFLHLGQNAASFFGIGKKQGDAFPRIQILGNPLYAPEIGKSDVGNPLGARKRAFGAGGTLVKSRNEALEPRIPKPYANAAVIKNNP